MAGRLSMKDILKQFTQRQAGPLVQFMKYAIAGGIATGVDVVIFYFLSLQVFAALKPDDPITSVLPITVEAISETLRSRNYLINRSITFVFSNMAAYVVNILWVFEPGRHSRLIELSLFYAVSILSFSIGTGVGWGLIKILGLSTSVAFLANIAAALMINYVCRKFIIFKG